MEIKENKRNNLFKRQEIEGFVESEKNPGFDAMRKVLSEETKKPEENIDVYNIKSSFGSKTFLVKAFVYDTKDLREKAIVTTRKQRKEMAKQAAEEAKAKAEEEKKAKEASA